MSEEIPPTSHRRRRSRRWALGGAAVVVLAVVAYAALRLFDAGGAGPSSSAKASPTPLASMDLSGVPVGRTSPCGHIDTEGVATALGDQVTASEGYAPGDRVQLAPGVRDLAQEFGCSYRDRKGAEARVWVFSQPVDRVAASRLVRQTQAHKGCRAVQGGPVFGSPAITTTCVVETSGARTVALRGLFGDAWLTCQLAVPTGGGGADPVRRTQQWCVRVVTGLGASG